MIVAYNPAFPTARTDNLVVGQQSTEATPNYFMFFVNAADASQGSFRAGYPNGTSFQLANRGPNSFGVCDDCVISGAQSSVPFSKFITVSGANSLCGGQYNHVLSDQSVCCGGGGQSTIFNQINLTAPGAFIGGGAPVTVSGVAAGNVSGGDTTGPLAVEVSGQDAVNVSGFTHTIDGLGSFAIAGTGVNITAGGVNSGIIGGGTQTVSSATSAIGCGTSNTVSGPSSCVVGGDTNTNAGTACCIFGGQMNQIAVTASESCIPGGISNSVAGSSSFAMGNTNVITATGGASICLGQNATATLQNTFVWSDGTALTSPAAHAMAFCNVGGFNWWTNAGVSVGAQLAAGGSAWAAASDVRLKENLSVVDGNEARRAIIRDVDVYTYSLPGQSDGCRNYGPTAQQWHRAFPSAGKDPLRIDTMDLDGISLAAIKALDAQLTRLETIVYDRRRLQLRLPKMTTMIEATAA